MTTEDVIKSLGIPAKIIHGVLTEAKGAGADIILAQPLHIDELRDAAPIVIGIKSFVNKNEIRQKIVDELKKMGWLIEEE